VDADTAMPVKVEAKDSITFNVVEDSANITVKDVPTPEPVDPVIEGLEVPAEVNEGVEFTAKATVTDADSAFDVYFTFNGEKKLAIADGNIYSASFVAPGVDADTAMPVKVEAKDSITFNVVEDSANITVKDVPTPEPVDPVLEYTIPATVNEGEEFTVDATVIDADGNSLLWIEFNGISHSWNIEPGTKQVQAVFKAPSLEVAKTYEILLTLKDIVSGYEEEFVYEIWINTNDLSEAIAQAIAAIDALPDPEDIVLSDNADVENARTLVEHVIDLGGEYSDITNYDKLLACEGKIEEIENAIAAAEAAIAALPNPEDVVLADKPDVENARVLADIALLGATEDDIENYEKLIACEAKIEELETARDNAVNAIDSLPALTELGIADEASVIAARELVEDALELGVLESEISNLVDLLMAEEKIAFLKGELIEGFSINDETFNVVFTNSLNYPEAVDNSWFTVLIGGTPVEIDNLVVTSADAQFNIADTFGLKGLVVINSKGDYDENLISATFDILQENIPLIAKNKYSANFTLSGDVKKLSFKTNGLNNPSPKEVDAAENLEIPEMFTAVDDIYMEITALDSSDSVLGSFVYLMPKVFGEIELTHIRDIELLELSEYELDLSITSDAVAYFTIEADSGEVTVVDGDTLPPFDESLKIRTDISASEIIITAFNADDTAIGFRVIEIVK